MNLENVYNSLLNYVDANDYRGACHSTSAVMFMLFSELGLKPKLKIGEVYSYHVSKAFDHSWVEVDEAVYDVAIGYPQLSELGGEYVCGPIFNDVDINTGNAAEISFRYRTDDGLGENASVVHQWTLSQYNSNIEQDIWDMAAFVGANSGMFLSSQNLKFKYGNVMRELVK